jgi:hypothetical protein
VGNTVDDQVESHPKTDILDKVFFEFWLFVSDDGQCMLVGITRSDTVIHKFYELGLERQ